MKKLSKKGYKKDSPDKNNPYNVIPSGNITMDNVPFDVMGISLNTGEHKHMTPGNNYYFNDTDHVLEYPVLMQQGGQYSADQWNKLNKARGFLPSPGVNIDMAGSNSKYMEFYDPNVFKPMMSNNSQVTWQKLNDPSWKYTSESNSPFVKYNQPIHNNSGKKFVNPESDRVAIGFQPNYTTYKYKDGTTRYQDTKGNLYNDSTELQNYLESLSKMQKGGALDKFVSNYAKRQLNSSAAPQGESMDDFLSNKNNTFMEYISSNINKNIASEELKAYKEGYAQMGSQINLDNPDNPLQPRYPNNFYTGPFGVYGNESTPDYVNQFTNANNFPQISANTGTPSNISNPYIQNLPSKMPNKGLDGSGWADIGMAGAQTLNKFFSNYNNKQQDLYNQKQMTIDKTAQLQYGNRGDYDINNGRLRPDQYTVPNLQMGGTPRISDTISKGLTLPNNQTRKMSDVSGYNEDMNWLGEQYKDVGFSMDKGNLSFGAGNYFPVNTFQPTGNINPYISGSYNFNNGVSVGGYYSPDSKGISLSKTFQQGGEFNENNYQKWKTKLPKNLQYEGDYDLRGFYKENPKFNSNDKNQHLTDKFKLPNHPTFSDESIYYNEESMPQGGHWKKDKYVPNDPLNKKYKRGGEYSLQNKDLSDLLGQGYEFEIIDS